MSTDKVAKWEADLAVRVWEAVEPSEVEGILKEAEARYGLKTIPVGRDNNIGTIRMASDPGLALVERITNGIDSIIEREVLLTAGPEPQSPEEAARLLLGVPPGGLSDMTDTERRHLAQNLVVSMHESGVQRRPTVRVQDSGMGQHPEDFEGTLLSLNESNKVGKPYTMGTYGQGGSVTFGFSESTVIVSRRHPSLLRAGQEDAVGWTVVYEEETDPTKNILPRYVWVVRPDGSPFTFPPSLFPDLAHGVRISHVRYDVQYLTGPFTTQMWQFLHATLFDPVLPFLITGDRKNDTKKKSGEPDSRVIIGNAARLDNVEKATGDLILAAEDTHHLDLGPEYGTVDASWWALTRPDGSESKSDPAGSYVQANNAVSLTLHGQRQDAERRTWIKDKALLPHLYKNMVVHIDANGLTPIGRRELFASTRERATESELRTLIYTAVADLIRTDPELKRLNHEEKEKLLKRSTAAANEKVRKRLGKFIKTKLKGVLKPGSKDAGKGTTGAGGGPGTGPGSEKGKRKRPTKPAPPRNTDDSHLPKVPTSIAFESKQVRVARGFNGHLWVSLDAKNGYLPEHDDDLTCTITGDGESPPTLRSRSRLLGGKARWVLHATPDAELGSYGLEVSLETANGTLTASIPIEVVDPPEPKKAGEGGSEEETGPDVRWVTKDQWDDHKMDAQTVGKVDEDDESTIIWVNRHFDLLDKALSSSKLTADQIETRGDRYQYPVACGLWLQQHELKTTDPKPDEKYLDSEMHRLAEAVLVAMDPDVDLAGAEGED